EDDGAPGGGARTRGGEPHGPGAADLDGGSAMSGGVRMRAWQLPAGCTSVGRLELIELPRPDPAPGEVLVGVRAHSLNFRDPALAKGTYLGSAIKVAGAPLSDGAGVLA